MEEINISINDHSTLWWVSNTHVWNVVLICREGLGFAMIDLILDPTAILVCSDICVAKFNLCITALRKPGILMGVNWRLYWYLFGLYRTWYGRKFGGLRIGCCYLIATASCSREFGVRVLIALACECNTCVALHYGQAIPSWRKTDSAVARTQCQLGSWNQSLVFCVMLKSFCFRCSFSEPLQSQACWYCHSWHFEINFDCTLVPTNTLVGLANMKH